MCRFRRVSDTPELTSPRVASAFPRRVAVGMSDLLSAMSTDEAFDLCVDFISTGGLDGKGTGGESQADKLAVYKWFKQVNAGDVPAGETRPTYMQAMVKAGGPIAAAELQLKWDAWKSVEGTSKDDAKKAYVKAIIDQSKQFGREDAVVKFIESKK